MVENHRDEGRARWWKVATVVDLPELLTISNRPPMERPSTQESVDTDAQNTHVISLDGSRDRVGAKLLLEKLAEDLGIELNIPWNFVPDKIALIGEK